MDTSTILREPESTPAGVSEIPGEPAIIINGLSPPPPGFTISTANACGASSGGDPVGFGEWMEGREVRKLFGGELYSDRVAEFDKEAGWYKVIYEDGDSEDLTDWGTRRMAPGSGRWKVIRILGLCKLFVLEWIMSIFERGYITDFG